MLKRVLITNFLSIRDQVPIDIDTRVTILVGANDHGKTNILSALRHLNDDAPIEEAEVNWDALDAMPPGQPVLTYELELSDVEMDEWTQLADASQKPDEAVGARIDLGNAGPDEAVAVGVVPAGTDTLIPHIDSGKKMLVLVRTGIGSPMKVGATPISDIASPLRDFINTRKPRVELLTPLPGNLQDSVTASQIASPDFELMQGIFYLSGLDPPSSDWLFRPNDRTSRVLDEASLELTKRIRGLWEQGKELTFELEHEGDTIVLRADDPAVKSRKTRMSKRSDGVTQFFRLSLILLARRAKKPARSYIYLFDEPGMYLHPNGQKDLIQVLERFAEQNQIVYATHSLFMLNQNFPERHRLIKKDERGTTIDQKPYRQNWRLATDALGVYMRSNILFSTKVLLSEGDSDPIYLFELLRQLNALGRIDADSNVLGMMSFRDEKNLRYLMQVFAREGPESARQGTESKVLILADGDEHGARILERVRDLAGRLGAGEIQLETGMSIEDYCLYKDVFTDAVIRTLTTVCEINGRQTPRDLATTVRREWEAFQKDHPTTAGMWFSQSSERLIDVEVSKVHLARTYAFMCRDLIPLPEPAVAGDLRRAENLCKQLIELLELPHKKAEEAVET